MIWWNAEFESLIQYLLAVGTQLKKVNLNPIFITHKTEAINNLSQRLLKGLEIIHRKHLTHNKLSIIMSYYHLGKKFCFTIQS